MNQTIKALLLNSLKVGLAGALIVWLVSSGKLDFSQLKFITESPFNILVVVGVWSIAFVGMASLRWKILLKGMGIEASYFRTVQLTLIGLFFNSTIPGAVGGDIIKAMYVLRDMEAGYRTQAMLTIVLDRVIGLMGLFVMGSVGILSHPDFFMQSPKLMPFTIGVLCVAAFTVVFFALLFTPSSPVERLLDRVLTYKVAGFGMLSKIYDALKIYKSQPWSLVKALIISIGIQTIAAFYFMFVTRELNGSVVDFGTFGAIFPIGILLTALPLAPSGMGVGHVAFEKLYHLVGMDNGANVFNVYVIASLVLNLSGIIPYLVMRKKTKLS